MHENPYQSPQHPASAPNRGRKFSFARGWRLLCVACLISAAILAGYKVVEILLLGL